MSLAIDLRPMAVVYHRHLILPVAAQGTARSSLAATACRAAAKKRPSSPYEAVTRLEWPFGQWNRAGCHSFVPSTCGCRFAGKCRWLFSVQVSPLRHCPTTNHLSNTKESQPILDIYRQNEPIIIGSLEFDAPRQFSHSVYRYREATRARMRRTVPVFQRQSAMRSLIKKRSRLFVSRSGRRLANRIAQHRARRSSSNAVMLAHAHRRIR